MYVCMYACVCVCVSLSLSLSLYIYIYIYIHILSAGPGLLLRAAEAAGGPR